MDYNEILLQAIDTVVSQRISDLPMVKTIICEIVDNSDKDNGNYKVKYNDTIIYNAQSENTFYTVGDQVLVLLPADEQLNKTIISKYSTSTDEKPITYVDISSQFVRATGDLINNIVPIELMANGEETQKEICIINNSSLLKNSKNYDTLYLKMNIKTLLGGYDMRQGHYGILVIGRTEEDTVSIIFNSSKDMLGDVYNLPYYTFFEQAFNYNVLKDFTEIRVYAYQSNDFKYFDGVNHTLQDVESFVPNIFIDNIELYLGYNSTIVEDKTVKIYVEGDPTFSSSNQKKNFSLVWYNKDEDGKYIGFDDATSFGRDAIITPPSDPIYKNEVYYAIEWFADSLKGSSILQSDTLDLKTITISCSSEFSKYKVWAKVWRNGQSYISEPIVMDNADLVNNGINNLGITLSLENIAEGMDNYPLYGVNNQLIDVSQRMKKRGVKVNWNSDIGLIHDDFWQNSTIYWYLPKEMTMLNTYSTPSLYSPNNFVPDDTWDLNMVHENAIAEFELGSSLNLPKWYYELYFKITPLEGNKASNFTVKVKKAVAGTANEWTDVNSIDIDVDVDPSQQKTLQFSLKNSDTNNFLITFTPNTYEGAKYKIETLELHLGLPFPTTSKNRDGFNCYEAPILFDESTEDDEEPKLILPELKTFYYSIKPNYNINAQRNIIYCEIERLVDEQITSARGEKYFTFSSFGTSGTDYTLSIFYPNGENGFNGYYDGTSIVANEENGWEPLQIQMQLLDPEGKVVENASIHWKWYWQNEWTEVDTSGVQRTGLEDFEYKTNGLLTLYRYPTDSDGNPRYNILQAETNIEDKNIKLLSELPIPFFSNPSGSTNIPTTIVYDSMGANPIYTKENLEFHEENVQKSYNWNLLYHLEDGTVKKESSSQEEGYWQKTQGKFLPKLLRNKKNNNINLVPNPAYISTGVSIGIEITAEQQGGNPLLSAYLPILITQNSYDMQLINGWNSDMEIDQENNTILTAMIGAGLKTEKNKFNGVLMGDISKANGSSKETGLFGYGEGVQTFGFKSDGSGFIGKSGTGRIIFDGNQGKIASFNFFDENGQLKKEQDIAEVEQGAMIDFMNGSIDLRGEDNSKFAFNTKFIEDENGKKNYLGNLDIIANSFSLTGSSVNLLKNSTGAKGTLDWNKPNEAETGIKVESSIIENKYGFKITPQCEKEGRNNVDILHVDALEDIAEPSGGQIVGVKGDGLYIYSDVSRKWDSLHNSTVNSSSVDEIKEKINKGIEITIKGDDKTEIYISQELTIYEATTLHPSFEVYFEKPNFGDYNPIYLTRDIDGNVNMLEQKPIYNMNHLNQLVGYNEENRRPNPKITINLAPKLNPDQISCSVVKELSDSTMEWNKFIKIDLSDTVSQWQVSPGDFILTFKIDKVPYGWPVWFTNLRLQKDVTTPSDDLTPQEKFLNVLTNNGGAKGIFLDGEELYINANSIITGVIASQRWLETGGAFDSATGGIISTGKEGLGIDLTNGQLNTYHLTIGDYVQNDINRGTILDFSGDSGIMVRYGDSPYFIVDPTQSKENNDYRQVLLTASSNFKVSPEIESSGTGTQKTDFSYIKWNPTRDTIQALNIRSGSSGSRIIGAHRFQPNIKYYSPIGPDGNVLVASGSQNWIGIYVKLKTETKRYEPITEQDLLGMSKEKLMIGYFYRSGTHALSDPLFPKGGGTSEDKTIKVKSEYWTSEAFYKNFNFSGSGLVFDKDKACLSIQRTFHYSDPSKNIKEGDARSDCIVIGDCGDGVALRIGNSNRGRIFYWNGYTETYGQVKDPAENDT